MCGSAILHLNLFSAGEPLMALLKQFFRPNFLFPRKSRGRSLAVLGRCSPFSSQHYIIDENWTIFVTKKTKTHLDYSEVPSSSQGLV